jgi:hypothetical protein
MAPAPSKPAWSLFATCVLPGCRDLVEDAGDVCPCCVAAFGTLLRQVPEAERLNAEQIAERDQVVQQLYRERRTSEPAAASDEREWKPNQLCWLCEQRRLCTPAEHGWECRTCLTVTS